MAFRITAQTSTGPLAQSRYQPAGAGLIAKKWTEAGFRDVRVVYNAGRRYDYAGFMKATEERWTKYTPF